MKQITGRPRRLEGGKAYALYLDATTARILRFAAERRGCSVSYLVRELARNMMDEIECEAQKEQANEPANVQA